MATEKKLNDELRATFIEKIRTWLVEHEEEAMYTASGTLYVPTLDSSGNEKWVKISVIIPKDATEENGTDGYSLANDYIAAQKEKAEKAAAKESDKQKKIARDAERRAKKNKPKEENEE